MKTYGEIYDGMKADFWSRTGTEVLDNSDLGIRFSTVAAEIYSLMTYCDWVKRQMFVSTASGEWIDMHAEQRGLSRKMGTKASGTLEFGIEKTAPVAITVPKGSVVCSTAQAPVTYITLSDAVIPAGKLKTSVKAEAVIAGERGNAAAKIITVKISAAINADYVINNEPFIGGSDKETDEQLRERILNSCKNVSNGTNAPFVRATVEAIDGIASCGMIPGNRGAGTLDVFVAGLNSTATQEQASLAQKALNEQRELCADIKVMPATEVLAAVKAYIYIDKNYDSTEVKNECLRRMRSYISSRRVGQDVLTSEIVKILTEVDGITDVVIPNSYVSLSVKQSEKPVAGAVTVEVKS